MSLIDEALRRARQQAASQDAARRDEQYRQVPVLPPMASRRDRSARPTLIAAAVAVCVVAGIGIGVLLGRGAGEDRTTAAPVAPLETAPPAETPRPAIVVEETPEPAPVPAPSPTPTPAFAPERQPEEPPRQELPISEAEPVSPPPALDATPAPEPAAPLAPETTPEPEPAASEIRTYVREVPLPDGGTLRLNGIAYSATKPVALIDDRVLGKGESYQGFLVADIQAGVVELHGNGMIVRVSLK